MVEKLTQCEKFESRPECPTCIDRGKSNLLIEGELSSFNCLIEAERIVAAGKEKARLELKAMQIKSGSNRGFMVIGDGSDIIIDI